MPGNNPIEHTAHMASVHNPAFWGVPIHEPSLPVLNGPANVLDIGSGTSDSRVLAALLNQADGSPRVVRMDYFADVLAENPGEGRVVADAIALPLGSGAMHAVVTSELTPDNDYFRNPFLPDEPTNSQRLTAEIVRVLRMGGYWVAYNENLNLHHCRPVGVTTVYHRLTPVQISPRHMSHRLPFAVFERIAQPIDVAGLGQEASICRGRYQDSYTRALNDAYPVKQVLGKELVQRLKRNNVSVLDGADPVFGLESGEARETLLSAAKAGRWTARPVAVDQPNPAQRLKDLAGPNGFWLAGQALTHEARLAERALCQLLRQGDHYVRYLHGQVVILPTQQLLDRFVDFKNTHVDAERVQMTK
jgi:Methyltransferase domain